MTWCPDHDPLRLAGYISCGSCGRRTWPGDATWADHRLILATFTPGCDHVQAGTWLVDPDQLAPDTRWCGVLTATTGEPCRNGRQPDGSPCYQHNRRKVR